MKRSLPFGLVVIISLLLFSCENEQEAPKIIQGNAFGTTYGIQYFSNKGFDIEKGIDSVINAVNRSVSTYMPESDISKINRGDSTVIVDAIFKEVFRISEIVHTNSNGYFDPTVGVLRNAYGFGDTKALNEIDAQTLDSLMPLVGFRKVTITANNTVKKEHPNTYIDFNAVAKGFGIDCIGNYLNSQGVHDYLIELGGEILAKGTNKAKHKSWAVGIEALDSDVDHRNASVIIRLKNKAMAGSGNYRKFRVDSVSGKKYVHTINPLTGSAEESNVTSATVLANTCGLADAYATACMAIGFEKAKEMISKIDDVEVYLTYNDTLNESKVYMSKGFELLIQQ